MIEVKHLTKRFGKIVAVNDLSFEIRKGETFALLGPNGSGKTTALKCLVGLVQPSAGEILIDGLNLQHNPRLAKERFSFLPQRLGFHESLTAHEVMKFYCDLRKLPARRIDEVINNSHFDFNGFSHKSVGELSGGMLQRLGLAIACLPDVPILFLDEPTVSLDPEGAIDFREFLATLKADGKTVVFSSHVLADVERLADRVGIIVNGTLVTIESIDSLREELMTSCRMRIVLKNPNRKWVTVALDNGSSQAILEDSSLLVTSRAEDRMKVLQALEAAGGQVTRFATEELSLEHIYLRYIHASDSQNIRE